jgi:hypothetical protein
MTPSEKIDQYIENANDWRGEVIAQIRKTVHEVEPDIVEEWKWNSPVFSHNGMVCSPGAFKNHVGLNFFREPIWKTQTVCSTAASIPKMRAPLITKKVTNLMNQSYVT